MKRVGHGVFQFAPEHAKVPVEEWSWMRKLAQTTGATVSVNLSQPNDGPEIWRNVLSLLTEAQNDGVPIVAQVAGRTIGVLMCLEGSAHPLLFHPAYNEVAHLPLAERCKALQEPQLRERIINEMPNDGGLFQKVILDNASHMFPVMSANIDYEPLPSASATAIAMNANKKVMEILLDQLVANEGHGLIYMPFFNYAYGDLSMTHELLQHPNTRNGLSDAGAHCGVICDASLNTSMLSHWVREKGVLTIEQGVRALTSRPAEVFGITDRGRLEVGLPADVVVFDPATIDPRIQQLRDSGQLLLYLLH